MADLGYFAFRHTAAEYDDDAAFDFTPRVEERPGYRLKQHLRALRRSGPKNLVRVHLNIISGFSFADHAPPSSGAAWLSWYQETPRERRAAPENRRISMTGHTARLRSPNI
jgi:hypothetical protein